MPRRPSLLLPALILLAGFATYWNSLDGPFVWDDQTAIVANETIRHVRTAWAPPRETPVAGRPVINVSLALNYAAGGLEVTGYHAANVAVHLVCALLLFAIVRRTFEGAVPAPPKADGRARPERVAFVAALLWVVHPLPSEAVDYLTQRTESIMALFFLLTLYCAIRARRSVTYAARWEAAAVVSCLLGMASKETMVTAPLVVLLYDRVFEFDSFGRALRARRNFYAGLAATWLVLAGLIVSAARSTVGLTDTAGPWTSLLNQIPLIVQYLKLTVWPRVLILDYGLPRPLSFGDIFPDALLLAVLVAASAAAFVRWPRAAVPAVLFFLTLAPSSSFVPVLTEVGAERRMYLPSAALAVLAAVAGWALLERLRARYPKHTRLLVMGAAGLVVVAVAALAARTIVRNQEYASPLTLWENVVRFRPNGRARLALATELIAASRHDEAMTELNQAVQDFPDARFALGTELFAAGQPERAATELEAFIGAQPSNPNRLPGRLLLGQILLNQGRLADAARQFQAIIDRDSSQAVARQGLSAVGHAYRDRAETLVRQGSVKDGEMHAREAVRLLPEDPAARNTLGVALASQDRLDEAIAEFQQVLQVSPDNQQARNNLAFALKLIRAQNR